MNKILTYLYKSPVGALKFQTNNDDSIVSLCPCETDFIQDKNTEFSNLIRIELDEYFYGNRKVFNIKFCPSGTDFQKRVWAQILKIGYGETKSYSQIAQELGGINYSRAVGGACNKNPIIIIIPCHRVISSDGQIGGYAYGSSIKKNLQNFEKSHNF